MNKPQPSRTAAFAQRSLVGPDQGSSPARDSSVSTVRVKLIGVSDEASACAPAPSSARTRRHTRALGLAADRAPVNDHAPWRDVRGPVQNPERSYQALAFARTMPAIPLDQLGLESEASGVREIRRLQLRLDPSEPVTPGEEITGSVTLRVAALKRNPLARVWERWAQQSPVVAIWTLAVMCVLSALAVNVLAR